MKTLYVILTALLSVVAIFIIAKIIGHKQVSQLDFFDYITGITIGSIAAELATELEEPLKPLIAMVVYGIVSFLLGSLTRKFPKSRKFINGTPSIIMHNGKIFRKNMKKAKLELSEFMVMLRQAGYFNLNDIETVVFEYNGRMSILPKSTKRPMNCEDMNLPTEKESFSTEVIMDGKILFDNLKRMGVNEKWLLKSLKDTDCKEPKDIFLAVCDQNMQITVFAKE